jgi:arylsulfatase
MTGRHPFRNGITHTIIQRERLTLTATTLPEVLKKVGYQSGIFGKWHLGDEDEYQPERRGFDETFIHGCGGIGQEYESSGADAPHNTYQDPNIKQNGKFVKTHGFCTDVFFTAALGWIKQQHEAKTPFFAYIATNAPHSPYIAPEKNTARFKQLGFNDENAGFYGMVENIDENIGRLMAKLKEWNMLEDTLIVFTSDNGMAHGGVGKKMAAIGKDAKGEPIYGWNAGMKGLKNSPDEGGVRVPLFVRWDKHIVPGRDIDQITAHIDIFPTLCAMTGATVPENQVEGRSLVSLLEGTNIKWPDRYLVTHIGRWPKDAEPDDYQWKDFAIRNQQYRFVNNKFLYDMQQDPGQNTNLIEQHPEVVAEMRNYYDEWWKVTRPMLVNEKAPLIPTKPFHVQFFEQQKSTGIPDWISPAL